MTLRDKFKKCKEAEDAEQLEKIADDYAIEFIEWYFDLDNEYIAMLSAKKLLQIFKKEKEL